MEKGDIDFSLDIGMMQRAGWIEFFLEFVVVSIFLLLYGGLNSTGNHTKSEFIFLKSHSIETSTPTLLSKGEILNSE